MGLPQNLDIVVRPASGLTFPWAEYLTKRWVSGDASLGVEGVDALFNMIIRFEDLNDALQQLLGYSFRQGPPLLVPLLSRQLPWRHPRFTNLWCTRIAKFQGLQKLDDLYEVAPALQIGNMLLGETTKFEYALLTLHFTRPPYVILTDAQVAGAGEFYRYTDRTWVPETQILAREGQVFRFSEGAANAPNTLPFPSPVGTPITKLELVRTWYQIPHEAIFTAEPAGFPINLLYADGDTTKPLAGSVNSGVFLGCAIGTLLYKGFKLTTRPLHLPAELMGIASRLFQLQYDVSLCFQYFDPPPFAANRGHNLAPWAGDLQGRWYIVKNEAGATPLPYQDHSKLFQIR